MARQIYMFFGLLLLIGSISSSAFDGFDDEGEGPAEELQPAERSDEVMRQKIINSKVRYPFHGQKYRIQRVDAQDEELDFSDDGDPEMSINGVIR